MITMHFLPRSEQHGEQERDCPGSPFATPGVSKGWAPGALTHSPRCRSVRRNPVTITTTGTWAIVMPLAYDVASVRQPAATTAATCVDHRRRSGYQSSSVAAPRRDPVTSTKYRSRWPVLLFACFLCSPYFPCLPRNIVPFAEQGVETTDDSSKGSLSPALHLA